MRSVLARLAGSGYRSERSSLVLRPKFGREEVITYEGDENLGTAVGYRNRMANASNSPPMPARLPYHRRASDNLGYRGFAVAQGRAILRSAGSETFSEPALLRSLGDNEIPSRMDGAREVEPNAFLGRCPRDRPRLHGTPLFKNLAL